MCVAFSFRVGDYVRSVQQSTGENLHGCIKCDVNAKTLTMSSVQVAVLAPASLHREPSDSCCSH